MNLRETFRYLGYHGQEPDEAAKNLAVICWKELEQAATSRSFYREYPLEFTGDTGIVTPVFETQSANLRKNLKDCEKLLVFAATLGAGVDHCDEVNEQIRRDYEIRGLYLRPRFSPGYGDFPLSCQPQLLGCLEAGKRNGITLTDSYLMAPSKSVTAVIGVSPLSRTCTVKGCEACGKTDCTYRRG